MTRAVRDARWRRWLALFTIAAVVAFVALDVVASRLAAEGYSMRRDYVSSLAAVGSSVGLLGQLCLIAYAVAHMVAGAVMLTAWRTKVAGAFLVLAGILFTGTAAFRAHCGDGEAGCGLGEQGSAAGGPAALEAGMHGVMAGLYALVMFAVFGIAAISAIWERGATRVVALLAIPFGWASFTGIGQMDAIGATGAWERLWLGASVGWLVVVAVVALSRRSPARPAGPSPGTPCATPGSPPGP
ncbi:DUF998 domain-containing protein [Nocardioides sp. AE5]|uniref:DUF998 domain-containing protein n=1 Tax=Nocardioides sp. AE5 TaxID=2962573 RepID=UPI002880FD3C|nr:DUF998 domain-containing protein [Nocardioides sp. AE5]MDT0201462.1 DUF998 domain-containing protein [Nocardioides sp. AE5]